MKGIETRTAMLAALLCQDSIQTRAHVMGLSRTDAMATRRLDDTHPASTRLLDSCYPDVSKLKIESVTGENIAVFELQVLSDGVNVALNKTASQSSTLGTRTASLAVDGSATTFSHTNDTSAFWEVDLGGTFPTEFVKIKNRWCSNTSDPNGCLCRLSGATLSLMDEQSVVVSTKTIGNTYGVHDLSFDFSSCTPTTTVPSASTPSITISDATVYGDDSFALTFSNPLNHSEIYAAVVSNSACTSENSSFEIDSDTENASFGTSSVTISKSIGDLITAEDRNNGSVKLTFCLRADVQTASFLSSLLASKVSVGITVKFESDNSFQIDMQASEFSSTFAAYSSERGVHLSAILGQCASPGSEAPYGIGSTLKFCVRSTDTDVVISGLKDVSFTDLSGNPILEIIDSNGEPSFISSVAGLNSKSVDVATLMATTIYDQGYGGTTINVKGSVSVTYIKANSARRRQLKYIEENQPFALWIFLGENVNKENAFEGSNSVALLNRAVATVATVVLGTVFLFP